MVGLPGGAKAAQPSRREQSNHPPFPAPQTHVPLALRAVAPSAYPTNASEFGASLRALRGVGLGTLASEQSGNLVLSKSQLHRYESGQLLPPLKHAEHLDRLYRANGWVAMTLRTLWRPRWDPWAQGEERCIRLHAVSWPAPYSGPVWIKIKPAASWADQTHQVVLEWGPWLQDVTLHLPVGGVVLMTGKSADLDGVSRTCNVTTSPPTFLLHGAGDDLSEEVVRDIRRGWAKAPHEAPADEYKHGPSASE